MSNEFTVYPAKLTGSAQSIIKFKTSVLYLNQQMNNICNTLKKNGDYQDVVTVLENISSGNEVIVKDIFALSESLVEITDAYKNAEQNIIAQNVGEILINSWQEGSLESDSSEDDGIWDFIKDALWQVLVGDFEEDSNWLGILLNVAIGFVPYVGQLADLRDLVADIYNLVDNGPTTEEWVALGFTGVGIIPGVGDFLKHADDLGPIYKHLDDMVDGLGDAVHGIMKHGDEVFSAIEDTVGKFKNVFDEEVLSRISSKVDDVLEGQSDAYDIVKNIEKFLSKEINSKGDNIGDFLGECIKEISGFSDAVQDWIADRIDDLLGNNDNIGEAYIGDTGFVCVA